MKRAVIVGGGITGLACAVALQREARERGLPIHLTVVERERRWGGKILTERIDGFIIEAGPDAILSRKPWGIELFRRLGLGDAIVPMAGEGSFIRHRGRLVPLPQGMSMLVPARVGPFLTTPLFSPWAKLRMGLEYFIPPRRTPGDESLGSFVTRRLGREALVLMAEPLLAGIYAGDADRLSLEATFPQFRRMEEEHGGLLRAAAARKRRGGPERTPSPGGSGGSVFVSLAGGLATAPETAAKALARDEGVELIQGDGVRAVTPAEPHPDGAEIPGYRVELASGRALEADAVVLAAPAYVSAGLIETVAPAAAGKLKEIPHASVAGVVLAYEKKDVPRTLRGTGYVVARTEGGPVTACTWVSSKWGHVAPAGKALFRIHLGRAGDEEAASWPDERLIGVAREELRRVLGIEAEPLLTRIYRWPQAMPQYLVGHSERVARIEADLQRAPGLFIAGAAYRGIGVPDCVRQGFEAADRVVRFLMPRQ